MTCLSLFLCSVSISASLPHLTKTTSVVREQILTQTHVYLNRIEADHADHVTSCLNELDTETSVLTHMHTTRCLNIEQNVANVRLAEMALHHSTVTQHCKGVEAALAQHRASFLETRACLMAYAKDFETKMATLRASLPTRSTSLQLQVTSCYVCVCVCV